MVDPTPHLVDFATLTPPVSWPEVFGNSNPIELEVGSGKGLFLANAAEANPSHNFFGIELAKKYARKAAERVAKKSLTNVRVLPGDALLFLAKFVPPASLRAAHVYFPDPWWKTRHRKRRVFGEPLVLDLEKALEPGAALHVVTDVEDYFRVIKALVAMHPRFQPIPEPTPTEPQHELDYLTNFERKYRIEGRPIYRASYRFDEPALEKTNPV